MNITVNREPVPNFCEDCRYYKPDMSIVSFFGLKKRTSAYFARCMNEKSVVKDDGLRRVLHDAPPASPPRQYYCSSVRMEQGDHCDMFVEKT